LLQITAVASAQITSASPSRANSQTNSCHSSVSITASHSASALYHYSPQHLCNAMIMQVRGETGQRQSWDDPAEAPPAPEDSDTAAQVRSLGL